MKRERVKLAYKTRYGVCYHAKIEDALKTAKLKKLTGKVNLILTSPPFPLKRKKKYGNLNGELYINWLSELAVQFRRLLASNGSIVIEMGNAWESRKPVMSIVPLSALMRFLESGSYYLCQQFIWFNNARLPGPAQWVTIERIRVKDSFTHLWWMSKSPKPKADNRRVLVDYSDSMHRLLKLQKYNSGARPSEHYIGKKSFLKNNKGAIPPNVLIAANTSSSSDYYKHCKENSLVVHPARMPSSVAEFFIKFLTRPGDLILDPFGGSNTTGDAAERLRRKWLTVEANEEYIKGSIARFKK